MAKLGSYIQESYEELIHKVSWPTWTELQKTTVIVLVALLLTTLLILGYDALSENLMKFIYSLA